MAANDSLVGMYFLLALTNAMNSLRGVFWVIGSSAARTLSSADVK